MKKLIPLILLLLLLVGCSKWKPLMTLKHLGDNQEQAQRYVARQRKLFDRLVADIKTDVLRMGLSKGRFIRKYGNPVISKGIDPETQVEGFLYRYATEYFTTDRVYIYFDAGNKLTAWQYEPYQEPEDE